MSMALTAETPKLRASSVEVAGGGGGGECQITETEREGRFVWDFCLYMAAVYSINRIEVRVKYSQTYY